MNKPAWGWLTREKHEPPTDRVIMVWITELNRPGMALYSYSRKQFIGLDVLDLDFDYWMFPPGPPYTADQDLQE